MNSKFKAGDRVVCIDTSYSGGALKKGETYTVVDTWSRGGEAYLYFEGALSGGWFEDRFKLAEPDPQPTPLQPAKPTRYDQVLNHLLGGHSLTQGEAIMLGFGTRLAATVHTLKKRGNNIVTRMKTDTNGYDYAEYSLVTRNSRNGNIKRV